MITDIILLMVILVILNTDFEVKLKNEVYARKIYSEFN